MMMLITYDVSTADQGGRRRLSRMARTCLNYGTRVQNSVFECDVTPAQWVALRNELVHIMDPEHDSLRFYQLGSNWQHRVEHVGAKPTLDLFKDTLLA